MSITPLESAPADRWATELEIRQAGAGARQFDLLEWHLKGASEASFEPSAESASPTESYCELRAETGEWVKLYLFELEFSDALTDSKDDASQSN